jgi:hypothetical protein
VTDVPGFVFDTDTEPPDHFNALIYGPAGSGKTTAAASAPGPIYVLNLEGQNALAYARRVAHERGVEWNSLSVRHDQDPRPALHELMSLATANNGTIVVDTFGKYRDQVARAIGGEQPSLPQWGQIGKSVMEAVRRLRDLPCNVVLICHEEIKDSDDGDRIIRPLIGGRTTEDVLGEMDVIAYCRAVADEERGVRYLGQLVESKGRRAKDRSGALGVARDLDLTDWLAAYRAALATTDDVPFAPAKKTSKPAPKPEESAAA